MKTSQHFVPEDMPCPLGCPRGDAPVLTGRDRIHDLPGEFAIVKCRTCGLMRTNPRPTPDTIGMYYPSEYGPYQDSGPSVADPSSGFKKWLIKLLGLEANIIPRGPPGRMLEIGCASGAYMEKMRGEGWLVEGIEFSDAAAQRARNKGFTVQVATVESAAAPAQLVDVVAAWMVLEHLHDPVRALRQLRAWVRPDGFLIASVPDAGSLELAVFRARWYALQLPAHLYHYSRRSLAAVLSRAGWEVVRVRWQRNCNNLLWSAEYLARDKKWIRVERAVRWLRTSMCASKFRVLLGWVLGAARQSGRMEIWARPRHP